MRKRVMTAIAIGTMLLGLQWIAPAWTEGGEGDRLERGIRAHNAALAGDDVSIDEALRLLGPDGWVRPGIALAYH
jgi:hypothetical protein